MRLLTRLGLQRPAVPRCVVHGRFDIAGVTVINPTRGRREGQTIAVADGEIAAISAAARSLRVLRMLRPARPDRHACPFAAR